MKYQTSQAGNYIDAYKTYQQEDFMEGFSLHTIEEIINITKKNWIKK
jgi:hypothetical protein